MSGTVGVEEGNKEEEEAEYHSKDFEWEELRAEVENDPSFCHHLLPFQPISKSPQAQSDSDAWKRFHIRHSAGKFFKTEIEWQCPMSHCIRLYALMQERRYLLKEFPELASCQENSKVLEVGCGNGSTVLPLLRGNENIIVYACDCSTETVERVKEIIDASNIVSIKQRFHPFHCDLSINGFPTWLACNRCRDIYLQTQHKSISDGTMNNIMDSNNPYLLRESGCCNGGVDFITLIFTLSAIPLQTMPVSIKECFSVLKPGGLLLFRDYGLYDMTMLRFELEKRVGFREYMRSDGTRSYFFCLDTVRDLFVGAGFTELELEYCCIKSVNRRNGKSMRRVWVHGKFQKPLRC